MIICENDSGLDRTLSVEVPLWHRAEDSDSYRRQDEGAESSLQEDCVLNSSERRLLDPDFAVKHFSDDITFRVAGDPGLIFIRIYRITAERGLRHHLLV